MARWIVALVGTVGLLFGAATLLRAQATDEFIPRRQTKPPGPPLSPQAAIEKMTVPPGFTVELVASEPDLVNPVAMTIDERGRFWITESLEYPRRAPGPGRDRIKVLEDKDGDGTCETVTIFAEGLNIPSGIAVGHGGVWVANAPDILFLQDTDHDGKADKKEVIVTGFGRDDTHELPNSLTWGPDGWLYGLNGVFNPCHVKYRGQEYHFTCALFRIHPTTRDFEIFCEGTSNPWGVAFDHEGSAFVSACVIDHLWHLTESAYYHRQGGPYPPYTWKLESIVKHKHQAAAYCGITFFDSDAYPAEYRDRLYMGNIHGNCINVDVLQRDGSTYFAKPAPDFLTANDVWFMPVVQKTGPDGSLYILDWYDRYHCYQDANRDPAGIDRLKGRLYRVRYQNTPRAKAFDLSQETDAQLVARLKSPNVYYRDLAQRLLTERLLTERLLTKRASADTRPVLEALVLNEQEDRKGRMHALWTLVSAGPLNEQFHRTLLAHQDATLRAWGVRAAGNARTADAELQATIKGLAHDPAPDVRLQTAIAARKLPGLAPLPVLVEVLKNSGDDKQIPQVVWQNLYPLLETDGATFVQAVAAGQAGRSAGLSAMLPRAVDRILASKNTDPTPIVECVSLLTSGPHANEATARQCLAKLAERVQTRELSGERLAALRPRLEPLLDRVLAGGPQQPLYLDAALLSTTWKSPAGLKAVQDVFASTTQPEARRLQALEALVAANDPQVLAAVRQVLASPEKNSLNLRERVLGALGRLADPAVAPLVLELYPQFEPDLQPKATELLTQRAMWAKPLMVAVGAQKIPASALNLNQVRQLLTLQDRELTQLVEAKWGKLRTERNPQREQVLSAMRKLVRATPGDAFRGQTTFKKVCGQCHKIYGEGQDVGPDITRNGRASFEQLLSNVFDPSLVIGAAYQAQTVTTSEGRVLTGLLVEDSPQRVVLKLQGGKLETIARSDVDEMGASPLSLMPEDLEKQLQPQELADLFAFLTLDRPPNDPEARLLIGTKELSPRESVDAKSFPEIVGSFAPGFTTAASGVQGIGIVANHFNRSSVLRTHPVDQERACAITGEVAVPAGKRTTLVLDVSHHPQGDWRLVVKANGKTLHESLVGPEQVRDGWREVRVDLSAFAGQTVRLEMLNAANNWAFEHGFWGRIEVLSEDLPR